MATTGYPIPKKPQSHVYNDEAEQILLRCLDGAGGKWRRHQRGSNLNDIIYASSNDNYKGE